MALGWILFAKGDRHVTAEMLYEEATRAKVPVSLATVYNTLHQFTDVGLLRQVAVDGSKAYFDTNNSEHHHFFIEDQNDLMDIPAPTCWSARRRCRRKATRSPASTSWCGCAPRSAEALLAKSAGSFLYQPTASVARRRQPLLAVRTASSWLPRQSGYRVSVDVASVHLLVGIDAPQAVPARSSRRSLRRDTAPSAAASFHDAEHPDSSIASVAASLESALS